MGPQYKSKLQIGTSGWSYAYWKEDFYPSDLPSSEFLSYYALTFSCVEVNNTFYKMPTKEVVKKWKDSVPKEFMFSLKLSRYITHVKKLNNCAHAFQYFIDSISPLKKNLGPILIQMPSNVSFANAHQKDFFSYLQRFRSLSFAIEGRHPSWTSKEAMRFLKDKGFIWVISHSREFPYLKEVTANQVYLRFHGPKKLYDSPYSSKDLHKFAQDIKKWIKQKKIIWVFFNNDGHGYAPFDAMLLRDQI